MKEVAVVGSSEFSLGFRLAGITMIQEPGENPSSVIQEFTTNKQVGVLVLEDVVFSELDEDLQDHLNKAVSPVTVVVGKNNTGTNLKQLIKKSIGVEME